MRKERGPILYYEIDAIPMVRLTCEIQIADRVGSTRLSECAVRPVVDHDNPVPAHLSGRAGAAKLSHILRSVTPATDDNDCAEIENAV